MVFNVHLRLGFSPITEKGRFKNTYISSFITCLLRFVTKFTVENEFFCMFSWKEKLACKQCNIYDSFLR